MKMMGFHDGLLTLLATAFFVASASGACPDIIPRAEWGAEPPEDRKVIAEPVPYVAIHHTYVPGFCPTTERCKQAMRGIQDYHKNKKDWGDIGYSFCIGGDENIYEGRGWGVEGAHTYRWNRHAIGVCLIGDFGKSLPTDGMLKKIEELVECGISKGHLREDVKYFGHRQIGQTDCPGQMFYDYIKNLPRWTPEPTKD